jgi:oxaloacetate decarboxylase (Na+ extruding) subunit gamma
MAVGQTSFTYKEQGTMQDDLIQQGIEMSLLGMGTVFIFLIVLVVAILAMSKVITKYFPEVALSADFTRRDAGQIDPLTRKIIQRAIDQYRKR